MVLNWLRLENKVIYRNSICQLFISVDDYWKKTMSQDPYKKVPGRPDDDTTAYSRRNVLDIMAAGGLASMLAGLPSPLDAAATDEVVRIGYLPITDATALLVAHALGYFEEEGLDVAKPRMIKGWSTLVRGFAEGHFNLVHLLKPIPVWMRYNNNFPVKIMAWAHLNGSAIVVGGNTGIKTFQGLGGRRIAIPFWYSMHNIVLQEALRQADIQPIIDNGDPIPANACALKVLAPSLMVRNLATEKIDGYIVAEPFNAMGELSARGKILRFTGDIWQNHPCCVICMHEKDTRQKPEWTQKVLNAIVRAEIYSANNKRQVARLLSRDGRGYLPAPATIIERAMTFYKPAAYTDPLAIHHGSDWQTGRIDFVPYPFPSATKKIVDLMNKTMVKGDKTFLSNITGDFVAKDLVEYRFVKAALENHPEWINLPGVNPNNPFEREEIFMV
jgi:NitT/TauT family transport system substrate-binding protein